MNHRPANKDTHKDIDRPIAPHAGDQSGNAPDMVCVTLQRPPHFWRFACTPDQTGDLLETLAEIADDPNAGLTWSDAELIASEIVIHHHTDRPSAGPKNDR